MPIGACVFNYLKDIKNNLESQAERQMDLSREHHKRIDDLLVYIKAEFTDFKKKDLTLEIKNT